MSGAENIGDGVLECERKPSDVVHAGWVGGRAGGRADGCTPGAALLFRCFLSFFLGAGDQGSEGLSA